MSNSPKSKSNPKTTSSLPDSDTSSPKKQKTTLKPHIPVVHAVVENKLMKEFREFINRGSMVDLAIGIAVGGAFTAIVNSLVNDIIMPIASLTVGGLDFSQLAIDIPNLFGADMTAHIAVGNFIQNVVNFLSIAFVVFLFVRLINNVNRAKETADAKAVQDAIDVAKAADAKDAKEAEKANAQTTKKTSSNTATDAISAYVIKQTQKNVANHTASTSSPNKS